MIKTKKIRVPIYRTSFVVVLYDNQEEIKKYFNKKGFDTPELMDGWVYKIKDVLYCVFYRLEKHYPTPGIIAHEAKHVVNNIFIDICHDLDPYNDEPEAYLLGFIVDQIHDFKAKTLS